MAGLNSESVEIVYFFLVLHSVGLRFNHWTQKLLRSWTPTPLLFDKAKKKKRAKEGNVCFSAICWALYICQRCSNEALFCFSFFCLWLNAGMLFFVCVSKTWKCRAPIAEGITWVHFLFSPFFQVTHFEFKHRGMCVDPSVILRKIFGSELEV